jgi:hypothetical protein
VDGNAVLGDQRRAKSEARIGNVRSCEMTMVPHPTFTFTKVIDTNVTHDLTIDKQIQSAALVIGHVADAEANATASGHDGAR